MGTAEAHRQQERLAAGGEFSQHRAGLAGDDAVGGLGVGRFKHRPFKAVLLWPFDFPFAQHFASRRTLAGLANLDVPAWRVLESRPRVEDLANVGRAVSVPAEILRQKKRSSFVQDNSFLFMRSVFYLIFVTGNMIKLKAYEA